MKFRILIAIIAGFLTYSALHMAILGYGNQVAHPAINEGIANFIENLFLSEPIDNINIVLSDKSYNKLKGPGISNLGLWDYTTSETEMNLCPKEWIKHGGMSADEPEVQAAVRHFYDPLALNGQKYLTNRGTYWEGLYPNPGINAIDWAIGDNSSGASNKWSWTKGKEYFVEALETDNEQKRGELMAKAWRCLGETLHNTADMGCPPHVRNDSHAAPAGLSWGWAFGSPDPYEELFNASWVAAFGGNKVEDSFQESIFDCETAREVNEKLAAFTNANFFTNETISGMGVKTIKSSYGGKDYPSPKLDNLEYIEEEFTFYKTFPSGNRVKMCKDKSYFSFRGYPYIDEACAKSQAQELIPKIQICGAKILALFIPEMVVSINEIDNDGNVKGEVRSVTKEEYKEDIKYNGKVQFWVGAKLIYFTCKDGIFEGKVDKSLIVPSADIKAQIECGGVTFISSKYSQNDLSKYKYFSFDLNVNFIDDKGESGSTSFSIIRDDLKDPISWNNTSFQYVLTNNEESRKETKTITMKIKPDGSYLESIKYVSDYEYSWVEQGKTLKNTIHQEINVVNNADQDLYFWDFGSGSYYYGFNEYTESVLRACLKNFSYTATNQYAIYDENYKIKEIKTETITSTSLTNYDEMMLSVFLYTQ
jgi:hypothetical protein